MECKRPSSLIFSGELNSDQYVCLPRVPELQWIESTLTHFGHMEPMKVLQILS